MAFSDLDNAGGGVTPTPVDQIYFLFETQDSIPISTDADNPSFITGLTNTESSGYDLTDVATGTIRNLSGRNPNLLQGTISFSAAITTGGKATIFVFSESSADGVTWTVDQGTLRNISVTSNTESYITSPSYGVAITPGLYSRIRMYADVPNVVLNPVNQTVIGGQNLLGPSISWLINESGN